MIDPKQHAQIQRDIARYDLARIDPVLPALLRKIRPGSELPLDIATWPYVLAAYERLIQGMELSGTLTVPASALPTGFPVGLQAGTESIVSLSGVANSLIVGPNGVGKTTLLQWALLSAYRTGYNLFIPDAKRDSEFWLSLDPTFVRINADTAWNPLAKPPWRTLDAHITEQVELFKRHFYGGEAQGAVARQAFTRAYSEHPNACGADVHAQIEKLNNKTQTYSWRDACLWASERWHKIRQRYPIAYNTRAGLDLATMLNRHLYLDIMSLDPVGEWITSILLNHIFQRNKASGTREITTVAALDEALSSISTSHAASNITGTNPIVTIATMNREYGLRLLFSTADLDATDRILINTVSTIALLPGNRDTNSLRRLGLTPTQMHTAATLPIGQAMLLYPGQLTWPVITTFKPLPPGLKERRPTPAQPPPPPNPPHVRATLPAPSQEQPTTIALNKIEEALLRYVATQVITTVSEAYDAIGAHYAVGDKAKTKLLKLSLISTTPITVHNRRGGRAVALQATKEGYECIGVEPSRRSRGGGAQSEFIIQKLHRFLGGNIELQLDEKGIDLLLRVDSIQHADFLIALNEHAHAFNGEEAKIPHNSLVGIEVECSAPSKTINNNLTKDRAAGIQHLLFAVMPKDVQRVIQHLLTTGEDLSGVLVINALRLLDALKSGKAGKEAL